MQGYTRQNEKRNSRCPEVVLSGHLSYAPEVVPHFHVEGVALAGPVQLDGHHSRGGDGGGNRLQSDGQLLLGPAE